MLRLNRRKSLGKTGEPRDRRRLSPWARVSGPVGVPIGDRAESENRRVWKWWWNIVPDQSSESGYWDRNWSWDQNCLKTRKAQHLRSAKTGPYPMRQCRPRSRALAQLDDHSHTVSRESDKGCDPYLQFLSMMADGL